MRNNLLILFAVLSFLLLSCEPKDKWINQHDSKANAGDIAKICKQVEVECGKKWINYSGVVLEIDCGECSDGYECRYNTCWDIDECENPDLNNCPEHSTCANEEGTYSCICDDNYTWIDSECVEKPQEEPDTDDSGDSTPADSDTSDSTDDSDSAPDNSDSTPDDDTDTADSIDDSSDSQPDDSDSTDDGDTSAPDEDADEPDEEPTTRTATCSGLPANASWNTASSITQTFDGNDWYPPATGFYSETAVANECGFKCNQGYEWNGDWGKCFIRPAFGNICTGQTKCYNNSDEITCPASASANFYGQDAQYAKLGYCYPPSFSIKTNNSGENIVVDNNTGLEWQQVISEETFSWGNAITHCENLSYGGYTDWRLPDPLELLTIVDNNIYAPAVNTTYFPNTPNTYFNTSTNHANPSITNVWAFDHNQGFVDNFSIDGSRRVRCVRGQELAIASFTTSSDGYTVTDSTTGLMWQKTYKTGKTWQEALAYCQSLNTEGYGGYSTEWRLPNKNEIASLVNYGKVSPASDFPDMPPSSDSNWFWSSSSTSSSPNNVWRLYFPNGAVRENTNKTGTTNVLCVRSEKINDPCENHTCGSVAHSSGVCIPENAFEYSCGCDEGYFWNGIQCKIMPECSASTTSFPCKDSTNHLIWSAKSSSKMTWQNAIDYCSSYSEDGLGGWHLPNIDELRTIIKDRKTAAGGECNVSEINNCLSQNNCWTFETCAEACNDSWDSCTTYYDGRYSKFGDTTWFFSSSTLTEDTNLAWRVGFSNGYIGDFNKSNSGNIRCVR